VTARAILRAGFELLVTLNALAVKGVSPTDHFAVLDLVGVMTFEARLREGLALGRLLVTVAAGTQGFLLVAGMVVTVHAGGTIAAGRGMYIVVEEDFTGGGVEHQPDGGFGGCLGEGGVADDGNEQKVERETIGNQQLSLGSHWHNP
jgi:hypothetical protein